MRIAIDATQSSFVPANADDEPRVTREAMWRQLRQCHPELATVMSGAYKAGDGWITLDTLPEHTKRWLWCGIQRWHPDLANLLTSETILEMKRVFDSQVSITLDDVVRVTRHALSAETSYRQGIDAATV